MGAVTKRIIEQIEAGWHDDVLDDILRVIRERQFAVLVRQSGEKVSRNTVPEFVVAHVEGVWQVQRDNRVVAQLHGKDAESRIRQTAKRLNSGEYKVARPLLPEWDLNSPPFRGTAHCLPIDHTTGDRSLWCGQRSPDGDHLCTRRDTHTGRHAAGRGSGRIVAVWW